MSKRADIDFLSDIKEAIRRTNVYSEKLSYKEYLKDTKTQDAVVRNLEIIGEAVKNISGELKKKHPQIPWKNLAGVRNKLVHHYFGVNPDIVWNIIKKELPDIIPEIEKILKCLS